MKNFLTILLAFCSLLSASIANEKPNIVMILSDDQGWTDYGFMGHKEIKTPHLDKLAAESKVFTKGYVASPLCRPSLASMLTGLYPHEHGITGNDPDGNNNREQLDLPFRKAFHQKASFLKLLTNNGYLAFQSGKWWEGSYSDGGFTHGMMPKPSRHGNKESLEIGRNGIKPITDFIDLAVEEKKPFFVWYAPFLPHTPHTPPQRILAKYQTPGRADDVANYYAMCEWFDETCGDLVGYLNKNKLLENTVIIYICDNGWVAKSSNENDPNQKKWSGYAIRSKGSPYEKGIRTPIFISWKGKITPEKSNHFAHAIDLFPTIANLAGLEAPKDLTGINLLDDKALSKRDAVFGVTHSIHNMTFGKPDETLQYLWCVENEWKLIVRYAGSDTTSYKNVHEWDKAPVHLYKIQTDPDEKEDVAKDHPEVVARLKKRIENWHKVEQK